MLFDPGAAGCPLVFGDAAVAPGFFLGGDDAWVVGIGQERQLKCRGASGTCAIGEYGCTGVV